MNKHKFKIIFISLALYSFLMVELTKDDKTYALPPETIATTSLVAKNPIPEQKPNTKNGAYRITCYLWTGNPMANGQYPREGFVATSDRTIKFGTKIEIDGVEYEVGDRTNARFQNKEIFQHPTVDIYWTGTKEECLKFGVKYKNIIIK